MCGIAGIVNKNHAPVAKGKIAAITRSVSHRGPDDEGYFWGSGFAFGHRRLIIQDLSNAGHQPMVSDDGQCVLVYNGEVYNYLELREELTNLGRVFQSRCDTEVVLQAYQEWGEECVSRFNGMWAFAVFDADRNVLFCSRDRFGIKPFYYLNSSSNFVFASELKQLVEFLPKCSVNPDILLDFILTSITDHNDQTFFDGLLKLPAGHNLVYHLKENDLRIERYYRVRKKDELASVSPEEAVKRYREVFESSVVLRLRSDVRVGTCLSGGLDSSSVSTIAALNYGRENDIPFSAITAVSTQASNDESAFARLVVENSGLEWFTVCPSYEDFQRVVEEVAWIQEEPFGGPSLIMQYFVMREARENGIRVLLDGQGGDETLLGYPKYYAAHLVNMYRSFGLVKAFRAVKDILRSNTNMSLGRIAFYLCAGLSAPARYRYYCHRHRYLKHLPPFPDHLKAFSNTCHDIFALQELENFTTNLPVLLRYEDKNSMAHSVETRLPFLDYQVVETALSLPDDLKIHNGWSKWLLRASMKKEMPDSIVWRRDKRGFEAPEQQWVPRHMEHMEKMVFNSPMISFFCNMKKMKSMYSVLDFQSRWRLYSIALWEKAYSVQI